MQHVMGEEDREASPFSHGVEMLAAPALQLSSRRASSTKAVRRAHPDLVSRDGSVSSQGLNPTPKGWLS